MASVSRLSRDRDDERRKDRVQGEAENVFKTCRLISDGDDSLLPMSSTQTLATNLQILLENLLPLPYYGRAKFFRGSEIHCRRYQFGREFFMRRGIWKTWKNPLTWNADPGRAIVKVADAWAGGLFDHLVSRNDPRLASFVFSTPERLTPRDEFAGLFSRIFLNHRINRRGADTFLGQRYDIVEAIVEEVRRFNEAR